MAGQYLGLLVILILSLAGALGAELLPESAPPYLGLTPLVLGLRLGWTSRRANRANAKPAAGRAAPGILAVAAIAVSNGGDNIGVYIPVFATAGRMELAEYVCVFLLLIPVWCAAGRLLATRQVVARALQR